MVSGFAYAGGEETAEKKVEALKPTPEPEPLTTVQPEPEVPVLTLGEEPSPEFKEEKQPVVVPTKKSGKLEEWDPDKNISYSELLGRINPAILSGGVVQEALGFRGYMSMMIAANFWHRAPGYGINFEYSWNRVAAGIYYSYRKMRSSEIQAGQVTVQNLLMFQSFFGGYVLYRWLPFDVSPHFLLGIEASSNTYEAVAPLAGIGVEARVYQGVTLLFGYSYHSAIHNGILGGGIGWSF